MILETLVERVRWCVRAGAWREATPQQARACKKERQSQTPVRACQRTRSVTTTRLVPSEGRLGGTNRFYRRVPSGQLRIPG